MRQAGKQAMPEEGGAVGSCGGGVDGNNCEGRPCKGKVHPEAASLRAGVLQLQVGDAVGC